MDLNIFLPDSIDIHEENLVDGYVVKISESLWGIYIVEKAVPLPLKLNIADDDSDSPSIEVTEENALKGIISKKAKNGDVQEDSVQESNVIKILSRNGKIEIESLTLNRNSVDIDGAVRSVVFLFYKHSELSEVEDGFLTSEYERNDLDICVSRASNINQFHILKRLISPLHNAKKKCTNTVNHADDALLRILLNFITNYSKLCLHIFNIIKSSRSVMGSIRKESKISVNARNFVLSLLLNLIFGIIILNWINRRLPNLENEFFIIVEDIITYLKNVPSWLMGSPAGLKLNRAFNNMLGKFFLNNIDLWWKFLEISRDVVKFTLQAFTYIGMFGLTFQAAILSDLLSFATLHIYCIYIYAARLYNVQISAIIALCRLFLGKKYNPLRKCVDTCQYDYHQLFIGTLAFTILLFLLPTTAMYYLVFTCFRILIIALTEIFTKIQTNILSFPVYSLILWLFKSKKIAGNIHVEVLQDITAQSDSIVLLVQLKTVSLSHIMNSYKSTTIQEANNIKWGETLSKLCRGIV